ncbi:MAG: DMT family transporter [Gammaproteobacteria bacterium]
MATVQQTLLYAGLMLVVGLGIPIFAALNGGLATRLQSPMLASSVALLAAIVIVAGALFSTEGLPRFEFDGSIPFWYYLGGVFVALYILGMTFIAPRFGVGNAVAFVLLGQMISMALIDHFGGFGAAHYPVTPVRLTGLALMAVGVFLAVRR